MVEEQTQRVRTVRLEGGPVAYLDVGDGPTLLFVHGFLVGGEMWRKVYGPLSARFRCVVPTLPLGGHAEPMDRAADLTPPGLAQLLHDFMTALDLQDVTVVACDTGGALTQLLVAAHPERVGRLVLTNCDAYEDFPPPVLRVFPAFFRLPGGAFLFAQALRLRGFQRLLYALLAHAPLEPHVAESYFRSYIRNEAVRGDAKRVILAVSNRYTLEAARRFAEVRQPVLVVWGMDDPLFRPRLGERLAQGFPNARLERVAGSKTFVSEDRPEVLTALIADFVPEPALV